MSDEPDLTEIEERLYSQIYHSTEENVENNPMDPNAKTYLKPKKRYFNTGINNISVHIDVRNEPSQSRSNEYKFNAKPRPKIRKTMNRQHLKYLHNVSEYDDINLKEIKARVDACPEFLKCLPQHIRKKLKKMNKRIAFIQRKKYLETINTFNKIVHPTVNVRKVKPESVISMDDINMEHLADKVTTKLENEAVICLSDDETKESKIKHELNIIEIPSSDDESTNKQFPLKNKIEFTNDNVFKRPEDDDVIFVEPIPADVISLENDAESNSSISTKSSIDRSSNIQQSGIEKHKLLPKERKELLSTPESNNSNDFLESSIPDHGASWAFNFGLHGTEFVPSKDSSKQNAKDVSGSESSCSVAACDLRGLIASNKCALFNEVDFETPSKNIFEESNMESFGNYITPNRTSRTSSRNILHSSPLIEEFAGHSSKKKKQNDQLPNLSIITPEEINDSAEVENENLPLRTKKKKKTNKTTEINTNDEGKEMVETQIIAETAEEDKGNQSTLLKLKKKRKKSQTVIEKAHPFEEEVSPLLLTHSQAKKKKKTKKSLNSEDDVDSSVQMAEVINVDDILTVDKLNKKKHNKSKKINKDTDCESSQDLASGNISSDYGETKKKRKRKDKVLNTQAEEKKLDTDDTEVSNIDLGDIAKPKQKRNKRTTSDSSIVILSEPIEKANPEFSENVDNYDNSPFESDIITLDASISDDFMDHKSLAKSTANSESHISVSEDAVSISSVSDSDYDFSNVKEHCEDMQLVNIMFKNEARNADGNGEIFMENILNKMSDDASMWKIHSSDRHPSRSPKSNLKCRRCRERGHFASQCRKKSVSICCLCSGRGHLEPRCPRKLCTNCGRTSKFFTTFCSRCAHTKHNLCRICKMKGHDVNACPDLWRRYHLTISNVPIVRPTVEKVVSRKKWCSGCGKQGHLEYQCQYFARDHCPTVPDVIEYRDHLYKGRTPALSSASSKTHLASTSTSSSSTFSVPKRSSNAAPAVISPIISIIEKSVQQTIIDNPQGDISSNSSTDPLRLDAKPPISSILAIPQPIGSNSIKKEAGLVVRAKDELPESALNVSTQLLSCQTSSLLSTTFSTFACSVEFLVSYLHAKYLNFHEDGMSTITKLSLLNASHIRILPDGHITIRGPSESICASTKTTILNHLQNVQQMTTPVDRNDLISYLEEILTDLSTEATVHDLNLCFKNVQDDSCVNKTIYFQRLNMMIYGHFNWQYGELYIGKLETVIKNLKDSASIHINALKELQQCLLFLIEFLRPIRMYMDIIDTILKGKSNFINVESLRIPHVQPPQKTLVIDIDPIKHEFVKISLPVKFMLSRWKMKLDVILCDEKDKLTLVVEGAETDINNALDEFRMLVAEGPNLPVMNWAVYNIITDVFKQVRIFEKEVDNLNAKIIRNFTSIHSSIRRRTSLKRIHTHLIVTRGLKGGREKLLILKEFLDNYKPSMNNDILAEQDRKEVQDAYNIVQFDISRGISDYKVLYESACKSNLDYIILTMDEYNILKEAKEDCPWYNKIDLSSPTIINTRHVSISITGTKEDRVNFKIFIFDYLDRVNIFDGNAKKLRLKLENALKNLWSKPSKDNKMQLIYNRIQLIESKRIDSYHVEILRKLYQQLHTHFFGCCRLSSRTGLEILSNNHVDILRAYIAYLETVTVVPDDIQADIFRIYTRIFGKTKLRGVCYKSLIKVSWKHYKKYRNIDQSTIFISDTRVKSYLKQSPMASFLSHSIIKTDPLMNHDVLKKFVKDTFMIIINNDLSVNYNLHILMRAEAYKLFSDSYRNMCANLQLSLQAIEEIKSYLNSRKALDLLHHIHALEENSPGCGLIEDKYQVLNIYLFGCCQLMDGLQHCNRLKSWYDHISQLEKGEEYITDSGWMNQLIVSYEYIFWRGKKKEVKYRILANKSGITNENSTATIPLYSNYIYDYLIHTRQGIDLIEESSRRVKVDIIDDQINENKALIKLTGGIATVASATELLLKEIDRIYIFKDIPLRIIPLRDYLMCKVGQVMNAENNIIPLTILRDIQAVSQQIEPSLPYSQYIELCAMKEFLCCQLNQFIYGGYGSEDGQRHLDTLKMFAMQMYMNSDTALNINKLDMIHSSLQYLLFQKNDIPNHEQQLYCYANKFKYLKSGTKLNLLPLVHDYLKNNTAVSDIPLLKMQFHFDKNLPFALVSGSSSYLSWMRDIICQYNKILLKLPKSRADLIRFINKSFDAIRNVDDIKSVWRNICSLEKYVPAHLKELNELYVKLHRHLFGHHQLGNGKAFRQILNQHLIHLQLGSPSDIISIEILQEIFVCLQYIEGPTRQCSSLEYEDFINESYKSSGNINTNLVGEPSLISAKNEQAHEVNQSSNNIEQNIPLPLMDHDLKVDQNTYIDSTNIAQESTSTGNIGTQFVVDQRLINTNQEFGPSIHILNYTCDIVDMRENIPSDFRIYLKHITAGKLLFDNLKTLAQILLYKTCIKLRGLKYNVVMAKKTLRDHIEAYGDCYKLRVRIFQELEALRQRKYLKISTFFPAVFTKASDQQAHYFKVIHAHLYGTLKLCNGQYHLCVLTQFLCSDKNLPTAQVNVITKSYDYIFGNTKKNIDYESIIQSLTRKRN